MNRKEFLSQVGAGAAALLVPACLGGLSGCSNNNSSIPAAPTNVDFTLDVSSGELATKGGFLATKGLIVAYTNAGNYIAVSAACTHEGTTVQFVGASNNFRCPNHGSTFSTSGAVTLGPASKALATYNTALNGTTLRVFS